MAQWTRHNGGMLTKHFHSKEFECKDSLCQQQIMNDSFLQMLQALREEYGAPITITSGFRCARQQRVLRGQGLETAAGISSHELGIAADLSAKDMVKLGEAVKRIFGGHSIGTAKTFYHVDSRPGGPRKWGYST